MAFGVGVAVLGCGGNLVEVASVPTETAERVATEDPQGELLAEAGAELAPLSVAQIGNCEAPVDIASSNWSGLAGYHVYHHINVKSNAVALVPPTNAAYEVLLQQEAAETAQFIIKGAFSADTLGEAEQQGKPYRNVEFFDQRFTDNAFYNLHDVMQWNYSADTTIPAQIPFDPILRGDIGTALQHFDCETTTIERFGEEKQQVSLRNADLDIAQLQLETLSINALYQQVSALHNPNQAQAFALQLVQDHNIAVKDIMTLPIDAIAIDAPAITKARVKQANFIYGIADGQAYLETVMLSLQLHFDLSSHASELTPLLSLGDSTATLTDFVLEIDTVQQLSLLDSPYDVKPPTALAPAETVIALASRPCDLNAVEFDAVNAGDFRRINTAATITSDVDNVLPTSSFKTYALFRNTNDEISQYVLNGRISANDTHGGYIVNLKPQQFATHYVNNTFFVASESAPAPQIYPGIGAVEALQALPFAKMLALTTTVSERLEGAPCEATDSLAWGTHQLTYIYKDVPLDMSVEALGGLSLDATDVRDITLKEAKFEFSYKNGRYLLRSAVFKLEATYNFSAQVTALIEDLPAADRTEESLALYEFLREPTLLVNFKQEVTVLDPTSTTLRIKERIQSSEALPAMALDAGDCDGQALVRYTNLHPEPYALMLDAGDVAYGVEIPSATEAWFCVPIGTYLEVSQFPSKYDLLAADTCYHLGAVPIGGVEQKPYCENVTQAYSPLPVLAEDPTPNHANPLESVAASSLHIVQVINETDAPVDVSYLVFHNNNNSERTRDIRVAPNSSISTTWNWFDSIFHINVFHKGDLQSLNIELNDHGVLRITDDGVSYSQDVIENIAKPTEVQPDA